MKFLIKYILQSKREIVLHRTCSKMCFNIDALVILTWQIVVQAEVNADHEADVNHDNRHHDLPKPNLISHRVEHESVDGMVVTVFVFITHQDIHCVLLLVMRVVRLNHLFRSFLKSLYAALAYLRF